MKTSIKQYIIRKAEAHGSWFFAGQMEDYIRQETGAMASNASRRMRELSNEGILERRYKKLDSGVKVVQYQIVRETSHKEEITTHDIIGDDTDFLGTREPKQATQGVLVRV